MRKERKKLPSAPSTLDKLGQLKNHKNKVENKTRKKIKDKATSAAAHFCIFRKTKKKRNSLCLKSSNVLGTQHIPTHIADLQT